MKCLHNLGKNKGRMYLIKILSQRRNKCQRTSTSFEYDFVTFLVSYVDSSFWTDGVTSEIVSILRNPIESWLIFLPEINFWIQNESSTVKSKLMELLTNIKQDKKKQVLDLFDTYLPVSRITFIWMLILLVVIYDLQIHQMNVKTTLLNG